MKLLKYYGLILFLWTGINKTAFSQPTLTDSTIRRGFERCIKHVGYLETEMSKRDTIIDIHKILLKQYKDSSTVKDYLIVRQSKKIGNKNGWMIWLGVFDVIQSGIIYFLVR